MIEKVFTINLANKDDHFICSECGAEIERVNCKFDSSSDWYDTKGNPFDFCPGCGKFIVNTSRNAMVDTNLEDFSEIVNRLAKYYEER